MAKAYKMFRVKKTEPGKLFPLFVDTGTPTPIGVWVDAKEGERRENGKVKSKLGDLCFRPGWHLSDIPLALHIGKKDKDGHIAAVNASHVWCECEYSDNINYQEDVNKNGIRKGKFVPKLAYMAEIPKYGFYRYKTNPQMLGEWIISGAIKINRVLTDEEVNVIVETAGYQPLPRDGGPIDLKKYGFNEHGLPDLPMSFS